MLEIVAGVIGLFWLYWLGEAVLHMLEMDPFPTLVSLDEWAFLGPPPASVSMSRMARVLREQQETIQREKDIAAVNEQRDYIAKEYGLKIRVTEDHAKRRLMARGAAKAMAARSGK